MDVCTAAGINNARMAKKRLDQADVSTTDVSDGTQNRKTSIINEAGLYDAILDSRKPQAKDESIPGVKQSNPLVCLRLEALSLSKGAGCVYVGSNFTR